MKIRKQTLDSRQVLLTPLLCLALFLQVGSALSFPLDNARAASAENTDEPIRPCGPIFFKSNTSKIEEPQEACLEEIALMLSDHSDISLVIDGHNRSTEANSLAAARAKVCLNYLIRHKGIESSRLTIRSFGSKCPHESGLSELDGRVEFSYLFEGSNIRAFPPRCGLRKKKQGKH